ncbi:TIGR04283 family arsenosugar biosynthesis glycosyltransferase [uncultured Psychroserpens sp.]|uniref:TIGR04283 family arsenosugar biosynthesis glycosyltransferase n=1 Tax=uncultured Psychroserpens sp. TaxID=255436 RepID=UPI0026152456|nr:TIGR04283 family arsenosugar biosynthesis glycosyltransferase [uncultured Psychroserpens sp.]
MISIIIPVLNEAQIIEQLIQHLVDSSSTITVSEIIIVDGGSTDKTRTIVEHFIDKNTSNKKPNVIFIVSEKGRAKQMNTGTKYATGTIYYFLHADSFPPKHFDKFIIEAVKKGHKAGCFRMQFDSNHWWLRLASWLTQFSWRACRGGDQSQFITKTLFEDIGGYDERYVIYEDNILINELYARNEYLVINKKIHTSARLYKKHGIWKLQYHFWTIYIKRWFGATADELLAYYKKHIC